MSAQVPTARERAHELIRLMDGCDACPREDGGHSGRCEDVTGAFERDRAATIEACARDLGEAAELVRGLRKAGISTDRSPAAFSALLDWLDAFERDTRKG